MKIHWDGMGHSIYMINIDKDRKSRSGICDESSVLRGVKKINQGLKMNCVYNLK